MEYEPLHRSTEGAGRRRITRLKVSIWISAICAVVFGVMLIVTW